MKHVTLSQNYFLYLCIINIGGINIRVNFENYNIASVQSTSNLKEHTALVNSVAIYVQNTNVSSTK